MGLFDRDHWQEIWHALRSNKVRTLLTAFGVFWGMFMLVVMLGSGQGLQTGVYRDFDEATNSFFVWTRQTTKPYAGLPAGRRLRLSDEDTAAIRREVPEVAVVAPRHQLGGYRGGNNVGRGERTGAFSVMGDHPQFQQIRQVLMSGGRFLNATDLAERRKVAVIGTRVVELLFERGEQPLGEWIRINGVHFRVVGLFRPTEPGEDGVEDAHTIYVPFTTFQQAFNRGNSVGWYAITARPDVPASVAEERVLDLLRRRLRVAPDDTNALGHFNVEEEFLKISGLFGGIRLLIWIVGLGTLAAGAIGVSNIMLVIVRERTHEIGIRRAVGATPWSIIGQVVLEAMILTSLAGYFGLMAGMGGIELARAMLAGVQTGMFQDPDVSVETALRAFAILIAAGVVAGLIPARRAVRIRPVEALRASG